MKTKADFLGEEQLEKLGEEKDEEEDPATERRREYIDLRLNLGEKEEQVACLGVDDDRRSTSRSGDVSLTIFITSLSCNESLTSFTKRLSTLADHQS